MRVRVRVEGRTLVCAGGEGDGAGEAGVHGDGCDRDRGGGDEDV